MWYAHVSSASANAIYGGCIDWVKLMTHIGSLTNDRLGLGVEAGFLPAELLGGVLEVDA